MPNLRHIALQCALLIGSTSAMAQVGPPPERMERVSVGNRHVAYHVIGSGAATPLLLVNGGPGLDHGYLHLATVWDRFARTRRVVFFDQAGTGQSGHLAPAETTSVEELVAGIEAIRRGLGADRLAILGHSWGGYLGMAYAARHPERVERLVLVASVPPNVAQIEPLFAALFPDSLARGPNLRLDDPREFQEDIRRHVAMSYYSPEHRARVLRDMAAAPIEYRRRQAEVLFADATAHDLTSEIGRITSPVLVGTGRFDANVSPRTAWRIHQSLPRSRFVVWERSGHYPMVEEPDAFFTSVEEFLRSR